MSNFSDYVNVLLSLAGGIGVFLLGMKFLSDGLQAAAGDRLKILIGMATNNRVFGVGVGALVTGTIQSSTVCTVLVVSFVDGGLMTLAQAVGVIMGANLGTTLTGWILTIKIDQYGIPLAGIAAIIYIFSKRETVKYIALGALGLGCVFLGLLFMKSAIEPVKNYPEFVEAFKIFQANDYFGVLKCAAIGCLLTVIVQSSTATIGITMVLASQGLIDFKTAAALVLGENLGTTITAVIASLGANNNARRAAYFHVLYNVIGVFYATLFFQTFVGAVEWGMNAFLGISDLNSLDNVAIGIAGVHTGFNIFNVLVFLLPCRLVAQILESDLATRVFISLKMLRKEAPNSPEIEDLLTVVKRGRDSYIQFIEIEGRVKKVLDYMVGQLKISLLNLRNCIENTEKDSPEIEQIFIMEKQCDKIKTRLQGILTSFIGSEETATPAVQQRIFAYERIFDSMESASDYIAQVAKLRLRLLDKKTDLLDYQKQDLFKLNELISEAIDNMLSVLETSQRYNPQVVENHEKKFAEIKDYIRGMRTVFWDVSSGTITDTIVDDSYSNMLTAYRKIRDHLRSTGNAFFGIDRD
ncbi:MAG: Na/Pi cotransporter family protein [Fibromonadaceae bacterium]|jgi:phosphate:Na+ symporter|nr:Na/Pi cotransporter family protein [Fibromonadaceae bacterium]